MTRFVQRSASSALMFVAAACAASRDPRVGEAAGTGGAVSAGGTSGAGIGWAADAGGATDTCDDAGTPRAGYGAGGSTETGGATAPDDPQLIALAEQCGVFNLALLDDACGDHVPMANSVCRADQMSTGCTYFLFGLDDTDHAHGPTLRCVASCVGLECGARWVESCTDCTRVCVGPRSGSAVHELDTSDCLQRPVTQCDTAGTYQQSFDLELSRLLPPHSAGFSEIRNTALEVAIEDGCVTRYYAQGGVDPLAAVAAALDPVLAGARFDCALHLYCGRIQGPDTLATP